MTTYFYTVSQTVMIEAESDSAAKAIAETLHKSTDYSLREFSAMGDMEECHLKKVTRCGGRDGTSDISVWKNPDYAQRLL